MIRNSIALLVLIFICSGCNSTPPIVEYNAAVQALEVEIKYRDEYRKILNDPNEKQDILRSTKEALQRTESTIARIQMKIKSLALKL